MDELSKQKYEAWHSNYNQNIVKNELKMMIWHRTVLDLVKDINLQNKALLEVGCGNGDFSNWLAINKSVSIHGIDFSETSIAIAEEKKRAFGAEGSSFSVADAENLPFPGQSFDILFSFECLEHVPSPQKMINELFRVLKPGGKLFLTTENYSNAYAYHRLYLKLRGRRFDSGSGEQPIENFFVYWRLKSKFRKAGFKNVKTFGKEYVPLLVPGRSPDTFTIESVQSPMLQQVMKPLARRMTFVADKL